MIDNLTTPEDLVFPQAIYQSHEIPCADYLMSLREKLTEEFLEGFGSLEEAAIAEDYCGRTLGWDYQGYNGATTQQDVEPLRLETVNKATNQLEENLDSWKTMLLKYETRTPTWGDDMKITLEDLRPDLVKRYPTAWELTQKYGEYCPISNYSIIAPKTVLRRHTGPENRTGKYVRIHIPLIIPEGDIFLEVNGEKVDWSDLFGFNNQLAHSAWNLSNEYRLVYIIDLDREHIGLPPGSLYDERLEKYAKPFSKEKYYLDKMENLT
jgi:hypothetical protein